MATTTNFGWETPDDTDLVKDGAAAIRTALGGVDTSFVDLKGGTTGQVLSKASNTDLDFTWVAQDDSNAIQNALLTTTGDTIYASSASTPARLGIGSTGQVLTVSGGVPVWSTPSAAALVGCSIKRENVSTALTSGVAAVVAFTTENFDTDSFHDNTTNNSRITIPTGKGGKYYVSAFVNNALGSPGSYSIFKLYKNGSQLTAMGNREGDIARGNGDPILSASQVVTLAAGDYLELYYQQGNTETVNMWFILSAIYLGA